MIHDRGVTTLLMILIFPAVTGVERYDQYHRRLTQCSELEHDADALRVSDKQAPLAAMPPLTVGIGI